MRGVEFPEGVIGFSFGPARRLEPITDVRNTAKQLRIRNTNFDAGEIVGGSDATSFFHAVLWKPLCLTTQSTFFSIICALFNKQIVR